MTPLKDAHLAQYKFPHCGHLPAYWLLPGLTMPETLAKPPYNISIFAVSQFTPHFAQEYPIVRTFFPFLNLSNIPILISSSLSVLMEFNTEIKFLGELKRALGH